MNVVRHFQRSPVNVMFPTPAWRRRAAEDKTEMFSVKWKPFSKLFHVLAPIECGKNKYLLTESKGNSEFCFPEALSVSSGASY